MLSTSVFGQTIDQQVETLNKNRIALEGVLDSTPYQTEQHQAIENYFKGLNLLALEVKSFEKSKQRFNSTITRMGVEQFCQNTFVDKQRWLDLQKNCTKNGFFICAEEVKHLDLFKESLKNSLYDVSKKKFELASSCK